MLQKIGKYQIVERVGAGAMGEVFKSFDPMLKRWVALKVFSSNVEITAELRARFFQEAQAGAMLSHPNIVTVHDLGEQDGHLFIVMELLEGEELRQLIARRKNIGLEEKLSLMIEVCKGVEYAHRKGVIHRDIKPGNIFVLTNGHVKLLDFGVARLAAIDTGLTQAGLIMGTLRYMSPEQCRGRADHRSDIFSAGAVFYELLTYRQAFIGDDTFALIEQVQNAEPPPLMELDPDIPEHLGASVHRALRKNPSDRFADIADMRIELEQIHKQLLEEAERARSRVRVGLDEVQSLEQALAASAGAVVEVGPPVAAAEASGPLRSLQRAEAELAIRIDGLRSQVELSQSLEPSLERAFQLTRAGDYDAAIAGFQRVVAQMPEHARAIEGLRHARDEQQRQVLAVEIVDQAAAALSRHAYAACVRALERLSSIGSLPSGVSAQAEELKRAAQAGLEEEDARFNQSDGTLVDTRIPDETLRPMLPSIGANYSEWFDTEAVKPDSNYLVLARRRRSRRRWLTAGALVGVTLIGVTYSLNSLPAREWLHLDSWITRVLLVGKESLPAWLPDLGARTPTRAKVNSDDQDSRNSRSPASVAVERRAEPETPVGRNHEVELRSPPVPDRTETPIELPRRSGEDQADRVLQPPSRGAKESPGATLSPERAMIGRVTPTPSAPAPHAPSPTPPPPSTRPILPALSPDATLNETVAWLTQVLTDHAKVGRLPSGVMYRVPRLDGCRIEWGAFNQTAAGYEVRAALNNLDPDRTRATERGGGWAIDLPWNDEDSEADQERQTVGTDRFTGLMVWFPEADTAKNAVSAFKRAIRLCSR